MKNLFTLVFAFIGLRFATGGLAQSSPPLLPPESRQFDFWLGEWSVTGPEGKPEGKNRIESVSDGAALYENWVGDPGDGGGNGKSLTAYNVRTKQWQQFWVGNEGGILELAGGLVDGRMVLSGVHGSPGHAIREKITWTPQADGSVRQLWEQSRDEGKTWTTAFDGLYRHPGK